MTIEQQLWLNTLISAAILIAFIALFIYQKNRLKDYDRFVKIFDLDKLEKYGKMNEELFKIEKKGLESEFTRILKSQRNTYSEREDKITKVALEILEGYKAQREYIDFIESNPTLFGMYHSRVKSLNTEVK